MIRIWGGRRRHHFRSRFIPPILLIASLPLQPFFLTTHFLHSFPHSLFPFTFGYSNHYFPTLFSQALPPFLSFIPFSLWPRPSSSFHFSLPFPSWEKYVNNFYVDYSCNLLLTTFILSFFPFILSSSSGELNSACREKGSQFRLGEKMTSNKTCQNCYCSYGGVKKCRQIQCSPPISGCTPITPPGHCCPTEYKCSECQVFICKMTL